MPVAGVGDHRARWFAGTVALEALKRAVEHRFEVPKVRGVDGDLSGEDDLLVVDGGLGVVGLAGRHPLGAHHPGVRV